MLRCFHSERRVQGQFQRTKALRVLAPPPWMTCWGLRCYLHRWWVAVLRSSSHILCVPFQKLYFHLSPVVPSSHPDLSSLSQARERRHFINLQWLGWCPHFGPWATVERVDEQCIEPNGHYPYTIIVVWQAVEISACPRQILVPVITRGGPEAKCQKCRKRIL